MGIKKVYEIFKNKKVLITGHTGFKGSWLSLILNQLGAKVYGYSFPPRTENDNYLISGADKFVKSTIGDIRDYETLSGVFQQYKPEIVFHLAAQPVVRESYKDPKETFDTNIGGTVNLIECSRKTPSVSVVVNITSDKCYENMEWDYGYRENDRIGGHDPYSASKGCSELITESYRKSFYDNEKDKSISSVRAGNVIGGGDWQTNRLIPDCIRSLEAKKTIEIRNPQSVRPWQHVLDPLFGYILLAGKMYQNKKKYSGGWNFGPDTKDVVTVKQVVDSIIKEWGNGKWNKKNEKNSPHEAKMLHLDCTKSINLLGWKTRLDFNEVIKLTVDWYKNYKSNNIQNICEKQINDYYNNIK